MAAWARGTLRGWHPAAGRHARRSQSPRDFRPAPGDLGGGPAPLPRPWHWPPRVPSSCSAIPVRVVRSCRSRRDRPWGAVLRDQRAASTFSTPSLRHTSPSGSSTECRSPRSVICRWHRQAVSSTSRVSGATPRRRGSPTRSRRSTLPDRADRSEQRPRRGTGHRRRHHAADQLGEHRLRAQPVTKATDGGDGRVGASTPRRDGAHPGYRDSANFGRAPLDMPAERCASTYAPSSEAIRVIALRRARRHARESACALYNQGEARRPVATTIVQAVADADPDSSWSHPPAPRWRRSAAAAGCVSLVRASTAPMRTTTLRSRRLPGALITDPACAVRRRSFRGRPRRDRAERALLRGRPTRSCARRYPGSGGDPPRPYVLRSCRRHHGPRHVRATPFGDSAVLMRARAADRCGHRREHARLPKPGAARGGTAVGVRERARALDPLNMSPGGRPRARARADRRAMSRARRAAASSRCPTTYGPDLVEVASLSALSLDEVIAAHSSREYNAFFLGFMTGFAYCGPLDPRIRAPRLASPRPRGAPQGMAVAEGRRRSTRSITRGWRLIVRTDLAVFDASREDPH